MPRALTLQKIEGAKPGKVYYPYVSPILLLPIMSCISSFPS